MNVSEEALTENGVVGDGGVGDGGVGAAVERHQAEGFHVAAPKNSSILRQGGRIVTVVGEVDAESAAVFGEMLQSLADAGVDGLVLDLSGVGFIGSSGLASLIDFARVMRDRELTWSLCALRSVSRPLQMLDADTLWHVSANIGEAQRAVSSGAARL
ncbi:STAS domain-containing protein [Tomitella gaofuii]|uniref:STAS domain-containing protein n=1 Tax=Tomitella gaofuii TaxID=2760083 RepID=UPI0015F8AE03|nr:STAS domain-containing protein [Tomitella gaofuii]